MSRVLASFALCVLACLAVLAAAPAASAAEVVVTPPRVFPPNFVDPTANWHVNERIIFRPAGYRAFARAEALVNKTGVYPFVYGIVPPPGSLKNTTNATLAAVGAIGTAVNATATALNFTSPVAGLGSDLAQAANNAIKTTNAVYNLTVGKAINATVYKVAVLPPRATVGKVNVTKKVRAAYRNVTASLAPLGRKMLGGELA